MRLRSTTLIVATLLVVSFCAAQEYQPKFKGDPAKSDSEAAALGFMRTVVTAQKNFKAKHSAYATSLPALAGTGSITRRTVASNKRGDYTVGFSGTAENYKLTMTPETVDGTHRAFFVDATGKIRGEEDKAATVESPTI
ncbi:hypothetical protein Acid345_2349 [Candidatus Koribacter versatilis Ellin345]|uniref:Uncharacterized protein n=1 Tax=Koribacter versatilis (strain Ellin345) TaxID=204669 RepID=Q1IP50_KORVE|nr:hypothetical protein [Candidatus Koribacter versatilis]ABF41350.1 hypothetical protein Acid345_2349 [Candidatus Koribacter versatilis Ellin345]